MKKVGKHTVSKYLFITDKGKVEDGGHVLNHELTTSLARAGHEVHLLMLGESTVNRPGVVAHDLLTPSLSPQQEARLAHQLGQCSYGIDRISMELSEKFSQIDRESKGIPTDPDYFTAVVGYGDVTGPAVLDIRDRYYPSAVAVNGITMDPDQLFKTLDLPEIGAHRTELQQKTFADSDLVFAHGIKSERDALKLLSSHPGTVPTSPVTSFLPGTQDSYDPAQAWDGEGTMNILMLGRMGDPNKGAVDTAKAVEELRDFQGRDIKLTLRGVSADDRQNLETSLDESLRSDWRSFVEVQDFTDSASEKERSIRESHAMVMATESESYGLAAGEYLAYGKPLLVAEGNGNGYAEVLKSWEGMPESAKRLVIDDSNTRSAQGNDIAFADTTESPSRSRHAAIREKIADLHENYGEYAQSAHAAREVLNHYTSEDMARSIDKAVVERHQGVVRHTRQTADGGLRSTSDQEATAGLPENLHGKALSSAASAQLRGTGVGDAPPGKTGDSQAATKHKGPPFLGASTARSTTGQARTDDTPRTPPKDHAKGHMSEEKKNHSASR